MVLGLALGVVLIVDMTETLSKLAARINLLAPSVLYPFCAASGLVSGVTGAGGRPTTLNIRRHSGLGVPVETGQFGDASLRKACFAEIAAQPFNVLGIK